jgi:hypothetical protein
MLAIGELLETKKFEPRLAECWWFQNAAGGL